MTPEQLTQLRLASIDFASKSGAGTNLVTVAEQVFNYLAQDLLKAEADRVAERDRVKAVRIVTE